MENDKDDTANLKNGHDDGMEQKVDLKENEDEKHMNDYSDFMKLDAALEVDESYRRKISITAIEERREENLMSSIKYNVYKIECIPLIINGVSSVYRRYNDFKW
eukprot:287409_1